MKLYFYRGNQPNFGDELNLSLMPQVFPNFFDNEEDDLFLGIGSVLFDSHSPNSRKIVFGSGYAGYTPLPKLDSTWHIYCVRGPLTAEALNLPKDKIAADTAILINRYRPRPSQGGKLVSFMPHWQSIEIGNWERACALSGIKFIDPRQSVDRVLTEIEASAILLTEAMHGAIVADALRVPWIALRPTHAFHRMKWHDWAGALGLDLRMNPLFPSSAQELMVKWKNTTSHKLDSQAKLIRIGKSIVDSTLASLAAGQLSKIAKTEPNLSKDANLSEALDKLETHAASIKRDFS